MIIPDQLSQNTPTQAILFSFYLGHNKIIPRWSSPTDCPKTHRLKPSCSLFINVRFWIWSLYWSIKAWKTFLYVLWYVLWYEINRIQLFHVLLLFYEHFNMLKKIRIKKKNYTYLPIFFQKMDDHLSIFLLWPYFS